MLSVNSENSQKTERRQTGNEKTTVPQNAGAAKGEKVILGLWT